MKDLERIGFLALALVASTLAWICLVFAGTAAGLHEHGAQGLGLLLVLLSAGYGLLTLALALRGLGRFDPLQGRALQISLSAAGFLAALPVGITFRLGDEPGVVTVAALALAVLPWAIPAGDKVSLKRENTEA